MKQPFAIETSDSGVTALKLRRGKKARVSAANGNRWRRVAENELAGYFSGKTRFFSALCDLDRLSPFTRAVLKATAEIPYGEVRSYRWIAEKIGKPGAARAVGNALARNPIPIIIPCHRVVRSDGTIGGFALGAGWKKRLLALERKS